MYLWADLHGTIFVSCDKLTAGLRHDLRLPQRFKTCFKMLRHFSDIHTNHKSCCRPVVSLSHETKNVPCKSALKDINLKQIYYFWQYCIGGECYRPRNKNGKSVNQWWKLIRCLSPQTHDFVWNVAMSKITGSTHLKSLGLN